MNMDRNMIDEYTYNCMLNKWRDHICYIDRFQTVREYYSLQGWDIQYDTYADCWTIPAHQLDFFILSL